MVREKRKLKARTKCCNFMIWNYILAVAGVEGEGVLPFSFFVLFCESVACIV